LVKLQERKVAWPTAALDDDDDEDDFPRYIPSVVEEVGVLRDAAVAGLHVAVARGFEGGSAEENPLLFEDFTRASSAVSHPSPIGAGYHRRSDDLGGTQFADDHEEDEEEAYSEFSKTAGRSRLKRSRTKKWIEVFPYHITQDGEFKFFWDDMPGDKASAPAGIVSGDRPSPESSSPSSPSGAGESVPLAPTTIGEQSRPGSTIPPPALPTTLPSGHLDPTVSHTFGLLTQMGFVLTTAPKWRSKCKLRVTFFVKRTKKPVAESQKHHAGDTTRKPHDQAPRAPFGSPAKAPFGSPAKAGTGSPRKMDERFVMDEAEASARIASAKAWLKQLRIPATVRVAALDLEDDEDFLLSSGSGSTSEEAAAGEPELAEARASAGKERMPIVVVESTGVTVAAMSKSRSESPVAAERHRGGATAQQQPVMATAPSSSSEPPAPRPRAMSTLQQQQARQQQAEAKALRMAKTFEAINAAIRKNVLVGGDEVNATDSDSCILLTALPPPPPADSEPLATAHWVSMDLLSQGIPVPVVMMHASGGAVQYDDQGDDE
jgi:hypothetical protein